MKLLRDFFRLRSVGRQLLAGRRSVVHHPRSITVPAPLAHGRDEAASTQAQRHLQLVSSH